MKVSIKLCVITAVVFFIPAVLFISCYAKLAVWYTDFNTALAVAQAENKNIFLLFTGMEWDGISKDLSPAIFDTEEFKREAGKKYVLLHIDIPDITAAAQSETAAPEYRLAVNMSVQASPSALLVTKAGQPFAFLPMTTETKTPADVLKLVRAEKKNERKIDTLYAKMQKTSGIDKVKATDAYIEAVPERFHITLTDLFSQIIEADPENKSGLLGKYKLHKAFETASKAFHAGDIEGALNTFFILINEKGLLSPIETQHAYYALGFLSAQSGKIAQDEVIVYFRQAYDAAPDSEGAADLLSLIDSLSNAGNPAVQDSSPGLNQPVLKNK
ncbi:thioredoxin family protein [Treponema sp. OMZ 840]|uniref:thioredoxin family protein n=1 Tax=Treponema sp. OMZ 840 TaxID=244313 RepID=UPI003D8B5C1B